ncbi:MAG: rhamnan synthesis F family protein [Hyphomonas sp.]
MTMMDMATLRGGWAGKKRAGQPSLFDATWYRSKNPDVAANGMDPFAHYTSVGWAEGRKPNPLFDTEWYLQTYPDVELSGCNPLMHYVTVGWREGRSPHPLFNAPWYLDSNPDVREAGIEPLMHYLSSGWDEGREPHPLFDSAWYKRTYSDVNGTVPLVHYVETGAGQLYRPNAIFDAEWYTRENSDSAENPLAHYVAWGRARRLSPSPLFDTAYFLEQNPDIAAAGICPLTHYLQRGHAETRSIHPLFDVEWYKSHNPELDATQEPPLAHYLRLGARAHRSPSPYFDSDWYLRANPSVARSGINPLVHYIVYGEKENRDPSPHFSVRYYRLQLRQKPAGTLLAHYLQVGRAAGLRARPEHKRPKPLKLPAGDVVAAAVSSPGRICVAAHIYYPDMAEEISGWLNNIPYPFDLLVSTDTEEKRSELERSLAGIRALNQMDVRVVENRGRDIAPLLVTFGPKILDYDFCLHLHSKKSPHSSETAGWFDFLMNHLLHSPQYVSSLFDEFVRDEQLGALYPPPFPPIERHMHWAGTFMVARTLMHRIGLTLDDEDGFQSEFPAGSMFWFRPRALEPLLHSDLSFKDFPPEAAQSNNTLAHAVERLFLLIVASGGYRSSPVAPDVPEVAPRPAFVASRYGKEEPVARSTNFPDKLKREFVEWDETQEQAFRAGLNATYTATPARFDAISASIIMPTYNRAHSIRRSIESVLQQSHGNFELIVIDDGSTDNTAEILETYRDEKRIQYVRQENRGVSAARNHGLDLARSPYVFYLDSDNVWVKDYLRNMIVFMEREGLSAAYAGLRVVGDNDILQYFRGDVYSWQECLHANYIDLNTYAHRSDVTIGPQIRFDERLQRLVDWDFMMRVNVGGRIAYAPFIGAIYYNGRRGERISHTRYVDGNIHIYEDAIRQKHRDLPDDYENADAGIASMATAPAVISTAEVDCAVRFFPDYRVNNAYQGLLYSGFDGLDVQPGTIEESIPLLQKKGPGSVVFHLHWTAPLFASAPDEDTAGARVDRFIQQASRFVRLGGRIFWTVHNILSHERRYLEHELRLVRALCELADAIHVHDADTVQLASEYYDIPRNKILVAQHGNYIGTLPDTISKEDARARLGLPQHALVFVMFGQLRPYKGLDDLLAAFTRFAAERSDCWLVIAGKPLDISVEELKQRISHLDNVILHPAYVPDEDVQVYLRAGDIAVLPYHSVLTSGSVFLAFSFALPVIAPRIGLLGNMIGDGVNGYLYDADDADGLETAMRRFTTMPGVGPEMSQAARATAESCRWEDASRKLRLQMTGYALGPRRTVEVDNEQRAIFVREGARKLEGATCAAIVLHYQNLEDTCSCVQSVLDQATDDLAVVVLSNAEQIDDALEIAQRFPDVMVVQNEDNIGYAAGNNVGLRLAKEARCKYFWIINPDVVVPAGYYREMLRRAEANEPYNLFGSTITFGDRPETIWFAGGDVDLGSGGFSVHRLIGKNVSGGAQRAV